MLCREPNVFPIVAHVHVASVILDRYSHQDLCALRPTSRANRLSFPMSSVLSFALSSEPSTGTCRCRQFSVEARNGTKSEGRMCKEGAGRKRVKTDVYGVDPSWTRHKGQKPQHSDKEIRTTMQTRGAFPTGYQEQAQAYLHLFNPPTSSQQPPPSLDPPPPARPPTSCAPSPTDPAAGPRYPSAGNR